MTRPPRRLLVAVDPAASFGRNRAVGPAVVERLTRQGFEVAMLSEADFELLRREAETAFVEGIDGLVVGGDGIVSLGVNLVAQTDVPLGIVAAGTGNDLARGLGLPHDDPAAALGALVAALARPPHAIDAGLVRHGELRTWFANVVSTGFGALVNERANRKSHPRGPSRYTIALMRELATFRPRTYVPMIDGVPACSARCWSRSRTTRHTATACRSCRMPISPMDCSTCSSCIRSLGRAHRGLPEGLLRSAHRSSGRRVRAGEARADRGRRHRRVRRR